MTIFELEKEHSYRWITDMVDALKSGSYGAIFTDFSTRGLDIALDSILISRYTSFNIRESQLVEYASGILADLAANTILLEKAMYIRQQMAYQDAEYNPIENYSQIEHEDITNTVDNRRETVTRNKGQQIDTDEYGQQQDTLQQGQRSTTVNTGRREDTMSIGARSHTTQTAPFESSTFYNKDKSQDAAATDSQVSSPAVDSTTLAAVSDTNTKSQHTDTHTSGQRSDSDSITKNGYEDVTERNLTRSGNIGVQTAAQMMALDNDFWSKNNWLREIATEIIRVVCSCIDCV
jgi:hypothetical protein